MTFPEKLSVFFGAFADDAVIQGATVRGIYDDGTSSPQMGGLVVMAQSETFLLPTTSLPAAPTGKLIVMPQGSFKIRRVESSGPDLSLLELERSA